MLAAELSIQETSLSGLAATSDTLLSAAGPSFCRGVSWSYTYYKSSTEPNSLFLPRTGGGKVLIECTRYEKLDTLVFACFDSSVSATVWFF